MPRKDRRSINFLSSPRQGSLQPSEYHFYREIREILLSISIIALFLLLGTLGFSFIEGWSLFDSLYMTVITLGSVGYQEVHPLTQPGRAFTIILILTGLGLMTVLFTTIAQKVVQQQIFLAIRDRRMGEQIRKLEGHTIICGFSRLARIAIRELLASGMRVVIIESDQNRATEARQMGYLVVQGDATHDEILLAAGIQRARSIVTLLPKDADNLYVILSCRELSPELFIMTRAEDEAGEKKLQRAGATRIISPYRVGGQKIAEGLTRPYVTEFLDLAVSSTGSHLQLEEIRIPHGSPLHGRNLRDAELRQRTNVIVAAIIMPNGTMHFNPDANTEIKEGATFIVLGLREELFRLERLLLGEEHE
jgi:voltage-gated potassium channel